MDEEWVDYDGGAVQEWHRSARRIRVAPDVTVIPERAFQWCRDLRAVDLSDVTTISPYAFYRCCSLERVLSRKSTLFGTLSMKRKLGRKPPTPCETS